MKFKEAVDEIKKIAKQSGYEGKLSAESIRECAEVYLEHCDDNGIPRPRVYMRTGDGHKPTHLSELQWLLVRTPSFRRWFGRSVVVDENGDPKVMYHGSWKDFHEFKPNSIKMSKVAMTLWSGPGFYFTDDEKVAKIYAGNADNPIYEVFLKLENPLYVDETGKAAEGVGITRQQAERIFLDGDNTQWLDSGLAAELAKMDEEDGVKGKGKYYYKQLSRPQRVMLYVSRLKTDVVKLKTAALAFGSKSQQKLLDSVCRHTGYDGVIHTITPEVKEWVVYHPSAIKSAVANDGGFDGALAKVEDSTVTAMDGVGDNLWHNLEEKGNSDMEFKSLLDSLTKMVGNPAEVHESGMDIVDHLGRHHQPKAIPEGGQYEEEGQYLHGQAKIDAAMRKAGSGKRASLLREHVAPLYAKLGMDSATRAKIQAMHEDIRGLDKKAHLKAMAKNMKDMKRHADAYNEIKDMGKREFQEWYDAHPEYHTAIADRLLSKGRYNQHFDIKGEEGSRSFHDDGTGKQKHEAWEEAKWGVGAKAMASMILFQEHADALNGAPDAIMANMISRAQEETPQVEATPQTEQIAEQPSTALETPVGEAGGEPQPQEQIATTVPSNSEAINSAAVEPSPERLSYRDREGNEHLVEHNPGGLKAAIHQSEVGAVQAEMRQAFADAGNGVAGAEEYAHALSHFLGRGNDERSPHPGMRQEGLMKHQLADKMQERLAAKDDAICNAEREHGATSEEADAARRDYYATVRAVKTIANKCGISADMIAGGTNYNRVRTVLGAPIIAENPDHQEAINALHTLANPEPAEEPAEEPTAAEPAVVEPAVAEPAVTETPAEHTEPSATTEATPYANYDDSSLVSELASSYNSGSANNSEQDRFVNELYGHLNGEHTAEETRDYVQRLRQDGNAASQEMANRIERNLNGRTATTAAMPTNEPTTANGNVAESATQNQGTLQNGNTTQQAEANTPATQTEHPTATTERETPNDVATAVTQVFGNTATHRIDPSGRKIIIRNNQPISDEQFRALYSAIGGGTEWTMYLANHQAEIEIYPNSAITRAMINGAPAPQGPLNRTVDANGRTVYGLGLAGRSSGDDAQALHGHNYEWPFRRNQQVTADQLTPELIRAVAYNLPSGRHNRWAVGRFARNAMQILEDPTGVDNSAAAELTLLRIEDSPNKHARRFMQILNAMHPDFSQQRERAEQERRQWEEQRRHDMEASELARDSDIQNTNRPNVPMNVSDEDYQNAVNRIVEHVGENNRSNVEHAMQNFRQYGNVSDLHLQQLASYLGDDNPVLQEARRVNEARRTPAERSLQAVKTYRPVGDDDTVQHNRTVVSDKGFQMSSSVLPMKSNQYGCNCYLNDLSALLRWLGVKVYPKSPYGNGGYEGENARAFAKVKFLEQQGGGKPITGKSREENVANLERLVRETPPNKVRFISVWNGHHNKSYKLLNGNFYDVDSYYHHDHTPVDISEVASHMATAEFNDDRARRQAIVLAKMQIPVEERSRYTEEQLAQIGFANQMSLVFDDNFKIPAELLNYVDRSES